MSLSFGKIILYSHKPEKSFHFLSFLLDVEATNSNPEEIEFQFENHEFSIQLSKESSIDKSSGFCLKVDDLEELEDLKRNIEFYHYKENDKKFSAEIENGQLAFSDPDGRIWRIISNSTF
jgi:hypothetical protein